MSTLRGMTSVRLVPDPHDPGVLSAIEARLAGAESLRAAVAFWRLDIPELSGNLIRVLSGRGFLCVDIHLPTDIDVLCDMKLAGANVYLHIVETGTQAVEGGTGIARNLLHTKIYLFESIGAVPELWVGSHNWTLSALSGLNIEASLEVGCEPKSELYLSAVESLEAIRRKCVAVDPSLRDYYKRLQGFQEPPEGPGTIVQVLEVVADRPSELQGLRFTLFSSDRVELSKLKTVGQSLIVLARSPGGSQEERFRAHVADVGEIAKSGIAFDSRLHAFDDGASWPRIVGPSIPEVAEIRAKGFWATVVIEDPLGEQVLLSQPCRIPVWKDSPGDAYDSRIEQGAVGLFPAPFGPFVRRAASPDEVQHLRTNHVGLASQPRRKGRLLQRVLAYGLPERK